MWEKEEIIDINKKAGGTGAMLNEGSLDFAISAQKQTKDWQMQLAHIARALLVDHAFENYNKRTAVTAIATTLEELKQAYDPYALDQLATRIAKKQIRNVETIRSMMKDVIR